MKRLPWLRGLHWLLSLLVILLSFQFSLKDEHGRLPTWAEILGLPPTISALQRTLNSSMCGVPRGSSTGAFQLHSEHLPGRSAPSHSSESEHNHGAHCPMCLTAAFSETPPAPVSLHVPTPAQLTYALHALPPPCEGLKYQPPIRGPPVT